MRAVLAAGLWWCSYAAAQPGLFMVDFGHAVPGHDYDFVAHYRNSDTAAVTVANGQPGCASCPNLRLRYDPVQPGESLALRFRLNLDRETADSVALGLPVVVRHGDRTELLTYTLRIDGSPPRAVETAGAVRVATGDGGVLEGRMEFVNRSRGRINVRCVGIPDGLGFPRGRWVGAGTGDRAVFRFTCRPEALLQHRSLTFEVTAANGRVIERFSLPVAPE